MVGFHPSSANRRKWSLACCAVKRSKTMLSEVITCVIGPNESKSTVTPSMISALNLFQSLCNLSSGTDRPLREASSSTVAIPFSAKALFAPIGLMYFSLTNFLLDSCRYLGLYLRGSSLLAVKFTPGVFFSQLAYSLPVSP
jgi:hypothetical protein